MKKLLFVLLSGLLLSCGKTSVSHLNSDGAVIVGLTVSSIDYQGLLDSEQYLDSVKWIKLETTDESLIAVIDELFITDEWIVVLESKRGGILFFDHDGNYSHVISRRGRGPQEYFSVGSLMIDELNENIIVYDIRQRKLIRYGYDGSFISSIDNFSDGHLARDVINLNTGGFLCYRQEYSEVAPAGLWKVDKDGKFDGYIYQIAEPYPFVMSSNRYALYHLPDNKIGFVDQNAADIYHIDGDSLYLKVRYEMPGKIAKDFAGQDTRTDNYYMIFNSQEKGDFILTEWSSDQNKVFQTMFSKKSDQVETGVNFYPIFSGNFILPGRMVRNNTYNVLSSWVFLPTLTNYLKPEIPSEIRSKVEMLFNGMTELEVNDSNPIIQLLYLKH